MKPFLLFICLIPLLFTNSPGQNWQPLRSGEIYNYQHSDSQIVSHTIWVDSVRLEGQDSVFYLNRIADMIQDNFTDCYVNRLPQFLGKKMIKKSDSLYLFTDSVQFLLKPLAQAGDAWLFDSLHAISATVTGIVAQSNFGQADSIKIINLSNGKVLRLSKNWGIYEFPVLNTSTTFQLVGIQNQGLGDTIPSYRDIFNFDVGDVFCYEHFETDFDSNFGYYNYYHRKYSKYTVLAKTSTDSSLMYEMREVTKTRTCGGCHPYSPLYTVPTFYYPIDTIISVFVDSTYAFFHQFHPHTFFVGNINHVQGIKQIILQNGQKTLYCKGFLGYVWSSIPDTACNWGPGVANSKNIYATSIGMIHSSSWGGANQQYGDNGTQLVGYIKGQDTVGDIYPDWFFTEIENPINKFFRLYPNPAQTHVYLSWNQNENATFSITNLMGKTVIAETPLENGTTYDIPIGEWTQGVYFIQVQDKKGNIHTEKFIKE